MRIISKHSEGKILKNDVLALSQEAKKAKQLDNSVVNATIGSLYDDNGSFYAFEHVDKLVKSLQHEELYAYSPSNGNADFENAVVDWVFGDYKDVFLKRRSYFPSGSATASLPATESLGATVSFSMVKMPVVCRMVYFVICSFDKKPLPSITSSSVVMRIAESEYIMRFF